MNMTEMARQLKNVVYMLDQLEVHGHENMEILLGSMSRVNQIAAKLEQAMNEMNPPTEQPSDVKLEVVPEETENK